jgi:hypothetical protein
VCAVGASHCFTGTTRRDVLSIEREVLDLLSILSVHLG